MRHWTLWRIVRSTSAQYHQFVWASTSLAAFRAEARTSKDPASVIRNFETAVKKNDLRQALRLKREYDQLQQRPRTFVYNQLLKLYAARRRPEDAFRLFEELRARNLRPTGLTFAALLNACAKAGERPSGLPHDVAGKAVEIFHQMESYGVQPAAVHYHSLMEAQGRAGSLNEVFETFKRMQQASLNSTTLTYNILLAACSRAGRSDRAVRTFERMQAEGFDGDASSWTTVLGAFARAKDVDGAYAWWTRMQGNGIRVDDITLKVLAQAFGGNATMCNQILEEARNMSADIQGSGVKESAKKQGGRTRLQYTKRDTLLSLMDLRGLSVSVADVLIIERLEQLAAKGSSSASPEQNAKDRRSVATPKGTSRIEEQQSDGKRGGLVIMCGSGGGGPGSRTLSASVSSLLQSAGLPARLDSSASGVVIVEAADLQRFIARRRNAEQLSELFHFVGVRAIAVCATVCGLMAAAYLIPSLSSS